MKRIAWVVAVSACLAVVHRGLAGDTPTSPALPMPATAAESSATPASPAKSHYTGLFGSLNTCTTCSHKESAPVVSAPPAAACSTCAAKESDFRCLWRFLTYRPVRYSDIHTYGDCAVHPPLYAYFIRPCAEESPKAPLPCLDGRKIGKKLAAEDEPGLCQECSKCGARLKPGCKKCEACGQ
jgi:hypothetical protein